MKHRMLLLIAFVLIPVCGWCVDRKVVYDFDGEIEGTLRAALRDACNDDGEDIIRFMLIYKNQEDFHLHLDSPLVIPDDCNGPVTIEGSARFEVVINGENLARGITREDKACSLYVYSNDHLIKNLTFIGNKSGAAICLFGQNNHVLENRIGTRLTGEKIPNRIGILISNVEASYQRGMNGAHNLIENNEIGPNDDNGLRIIADENQILKNKIFKSGSTGIVVSGDSNVLKNNKIFGNKEHGIWLDANNSVIQSNSIMSNGVCGSPIFSSDVQADCWEYYPNGAAWGIVIHDQSNNNLIGGIEFMKDGNEISFNQSGGIVVLGDEKNTGNFIIGNKISRNYGAVYGTKFEIDLGNNGIDPNDAGDSDQGPNDLLNSYEYLQSVELISIKTGTPRYLIWVLARSGESMELDSVLKEDVENWWPNYGGVDTPLDLSGVDNGAVEFIIGDQIAMPASERLTGLIFDQDNNTSEYGSDTLIGPDSDNDGILDSRENNNSIYNSNYLSSDTDGDGLPDALEDKNRDGNWSPDLGETNATNADSDQDGLSDWAETHGDGVYDKGIDTDPRTTDTDGDGLIDGKEDLNSNGIWDAGETSPLLADSDGDGILDGTDTCPAVSNPQQEPWYCQK